MPLPSGVTIVGFDPGGTTGVCVVQIDHDLPAGFVVLESLVIKWDDRIYGVKDVLTRYRPNLVIAEEFKLYKHKAKDQIGNDFPSVRVIGIIEDRMYELGLGEPVLQPASLLDNPPVQILPEHTRLIGSIEHRKDAYKHCRYFVVHARSQRRGVAFAS